MRMRITYHSVTFEGVLNHHFVESCLHMDDNLNNISHATLDQGLPLECSESEFLSDHLSDGDEYVPSKAEIRSQEYSSSEVSCDENDDTLREKPTERFFH